MKKRPADGVKLQSLQAEGQAESGASGRRCQQGVLRRHADECAAHSMSATLARLAVLAWLAAQLPPGLPSSPVD